MKGKHEVLRKMIPSWKTIWNCSCRTKTRVNRKLAYQDTDKGHRVKLLLSGYGHWAIWTQNARLCLPTPGREWKNDPIEKMNKKLKLLKLQLNDPACGLHYTLRWDSTGSVPCNLLEAFGEMIQPLCETKEISISRLHTVRRQENNQEVSLKLTH